MLLRKPDCNPCWDVLEEHLEEGGWLWTQWEEALISANHQLDDVATGEERRFLLHIAGLVLGGQPASEKILIPALDGDDDELTLAAALALLAEGEGQNIEAVIDRYHEQDEKRAIYQRAFELSPYRRELGERLLSLAQRPSPELTASVVEVFAFWDEAPPFLTGDLATSAEPPLQQAALRALCNRPDQASSQIVESALTSTHPAVVASAIKLGLLLRTQAAWRVCWERSESLDEAGQIARIALSVGGASREMSHLASLLRKPDLQRDVLWALGFSGQTEAVVACLPFLDDADLGPVAAEAISAITGIKIEGDFAAQSSEGGEAQEPIPLEDEDLDMSALPSIDADLAMPNGAAIRAWWDQSSRSFSKNKRYLCGKPIDGTVLLRAFEQLPMRRLSVLAWELGMRSGGVIKVETRAFTAIQRNQVNQAMTQSRGVFEQKAFEAMMAR